MRFFRALALSFVLMLPAVAQSPAPNPVEYVLGTCGAHAFTVSHAVLEEKVLTLDYHMKDAQTVVKDNDPLIFDVEQKKDKNGDVVFDGTFRTNDPELKDSVEIHGVLRKGRFAALALHHGNLSMVFYGYIGDKDKMAVTAIDQFEFCRALHAVNQNEIPNVLNQYVDEGSIPAQVLVQ